MTLTMNYAEAHQAQLARNRAAMERYRRENPLLSEGEIFTVLDSSCYYRIDRLRWLITIENDNHELAVIEFTPAISDLADFQDTQHGVHASGYLLDGTSITIQLMPGNGRFPTEEFSEFQTCYVQKNHSNPNLKKETPKYFQKAFSKIETDLLDLDRGWKYEKD